MSILDLPFKIHRFSDIGEEKAREIMEMVLDPKNLNAMKQASADGKPAISVLSDPLKKKYKLYVRNPRVQQFVAYVVKECMEQEGYVRHKSNHTIREEKNLFKKGTVFRDKNSIPVMSAEDRDLINLGGEDDHHHDHDHGHHHH